MDQNSARTSRPAFFLVKTASPSFSVFRAKTAGQDRLPARARVEYHHPGNMTTMPKTKTDETDSRPAAVASAGTPPGDLAHEIDLLGAVLRLTPEQRAAAQLSAAVVSSRPVGDR